MKQPVVLCLPLLFVALAACASTPADKPAGAAQASTATATSAAAATTPAAAGCARISVFDTAPRSKDLYRARLLEIDGELAGPSGAQSFRVSPGRHTLKVTELIDEDQFNDVQLRQRGDGRDLSKTLDVDVQANTTYMLAAHLIEARRNYILDKSYWEPVIYQSNPEPCQ